MRRVAPWFLPALFLLLRLCAAVDVEYAEIESEIDEDITPETPFTPFNLTIFEAVFPMKWQLHWPVRNGQVGNDSTPLVVEEALQVVELNETLTPQLPNATDVATEPTPLPPLAIAAGCGAGLLLILACYAYYRIHRRVAELTAAPKPIIREELIYHRPRALIMHNG